MEKRFSSPVKDGGDQPGRGALNHSIGRSALPFAIKPSVRFLSPQIPDELVGVVRRAVYLLLAPLLPFLAWTTLNWLIDDQLLAGQEGYLWAWTFLIVAIAGWQLSSRSMR